MNQVTHDPIEGRLTAWIDGAARGNPGPAAIGVRIVDGQGRVVCEISRSIGVTTNNRAEYCALLAALEAMSGLKPTRILIQTDSELLYRQMIGEYRVKNQQLKLLKQQADRLLSALKDVHFRLIPRSENRAADRLANAAFRGVSDRTAVEFGG